MKFYTPRIIDIAEIMEEFVKHGIPTLSENSIFHFCKLLEYGDSSYMLLDRDGFLKEYQWYLLTNDQLAFTDAQRAAYCKIIDDNDIYAIDCMDV
jgi:hypothetical protein